MYKLLLSLGVSVALVGCDVVEPGESEVLSTQSVEVKKTDASGPYKHWEKVRADRQAELDAYLAANADGFRAFTSTPVSWAGIPTALVGVLPNLMPTIWGPASEQMAKVGFGKNPYDPAATLPFGLGHTTTPTGIPVAQITCGGCHMGKVIGPDGNIIHLVGAPNTQFNQFRSHIENSVNHPAWDAAFGANPALVGFKQKVLQRRGLIGNTLDAYTYNPARHTNPPNLHTLSKPGYLDAIGVAMPVFTLPELLNPATAMGIIVAVMPPAPAQVDIPSVWRQSARTWAQWDGSIINPIYRNLAAEVGVAGDPTTVDYANAKTTAGFNENLPAPPYPFEVNWPLAQTGKHLYKQYCASCHQDNSTRIFDAADVGTDPNRTFTITAQGRVRLTGALRAACTDSDPTVCNVPDEEIIRDLDAPGARGYLAPPLDGIWARAPYLHNGSVPTLYHLLMPETRPATFIRGSLRYDRALVGFAWQALTGEQYVHTFDTTEAGAFNGGHDTLEYNGLDWSKNPLLLAALLEYMKTL